MLFDRYLRLARRRPLLAVLLVFGAAIALSAVAFVVLGSRGALVPTLLYLAFGLALAGWLGLRFTRVAQGRVRGSRFVFIVALPLDAFALFIGAQLAMVGLDLVLPFGSEDVDVVAWQYHPAGRGPGSVHLVTSDGRDREMPAFAFYAGPEVPGRYRIEVSAVEGLVMSATPLR
jgi:hypothetical protein